MVRERPSNVQREGVQGPHVCWVLMNNLELPPLRCISFISRAVGKLDVKT